MLNRKISNSKLQELHFYKNLYIQATVLLITKSQTDKIVKLKNQNKFLELDKLVAIPVQMPKVRRLDPP